MNFNLKKPCKSCPFRKDCPEKWLGKQRASEVANYAFEDKTFSCHKTTGVETGTEKSIREHSQCAGSMLLLNKEDDINSNMMFRLATHIFGFNSDNLQGYELVFETRKEMIEHHS